MGKYVSYALLVLSVLSSGLLGKSIQKMESKSRTALKKGLEKVFIALDQKINKLDILGQKNYLGQLTIQGSKWPILVQYTEDHWKIHQPVQRVGLDNNYFSLKALKISSPSWWREVSPVRTSYYRIIPQLGGGHRILEISNFETLFLGSHENLDFSFSKKEPLDNPIPFFNNNDWSLKQNGYFTWKGYRAQMEKTLDGISDPLLIQTTLPFSLQIWCYFTVAILSGFFLLIELFKIAKKEQQIRLWVGFVFSIMALFFAFSHFHKRRIECESLEKKLSFYDTVALDGAQEYLHHIEQLARSLQSIYRDDILKADSSILKKWPYIERLQWIDHNKNLLHEVESSQSKNSPLLKTLFLKNTGWILQNPDKESPILIHYNTENDVSIYLQMDYKPLSLGFLTLKEKANTHYSLGLLTQKNPTRRFERLAEIPFVLNIDREPTPTLLLHFLLICFLTLSSSYFLLRIFYVSLYKNNITRPSLQTL